jgi:hypothetical protein
LPAGIAIAIVGVSVVTGVIIKTRKS